MSTPKPLMPAPSLPADVYLLITLTQVQSLLFHGKVDAAIDLCEVAISNHQESVQSLKLKTQAGASITRHKPVANPEDSIG